jgi:NADPH:quinone reductase-like Zn-dependent oxidoreductase
MKLRYKILSGIAIALTVAISVLGLVLSHNTACGPALEVADGVETMKAVVYRCYGSPEVLEYTDVAKPTPADDEVLVKVVAASVNPLDWHYMRGEPYFMRLMGVGVGAPADSRMGVDFAGVVDSVGENVADFKPGDEVFGGRSGAFAEYVVIPESRAIAMKPANMSFKQAASVGIAGVTAIQALRDHGKLQPGQKVLINGASGGVGTFAVQVAKAMGAEVTGVCSARNAEMVLAIGADHVIDYKKESYLDGGEQYDLIIDMVGNHSLLSNRDVLTPDGSFVIVGGSAGKWLGPLKRPIMAALMSPFVDQEFGMILARLSKSDLNELGELMRTEKVTPVLDTEQSFGLTEVPEAISYSEEGHARGKIIIEL